MPWCHAFCWVQCSSIGKFWLLQTYVLSLRTTRVNFVSSSYITFIQNGLNLNGAKMFVNEGAINFNKKSGQTVNHAKTVPMKAENLPFFLFFFANQEHISKYYWCCVDLCKLFLVKNISPGVFIHDSQKTGREKGGKHVTKVSRSGIEPHLAELRTYPTCLMWIRDFNY